MDDDAEMATSKISITPEQAVESILRTESSVEFDSLRRDCEGFIRKAILKSTLRTTTFPWIRAAVRLVSSARKPNDTAFHRLYNSLCLRLSELEEIIARQTDKELAAQTHLKTEAQRLRRDVKSCLDHNLAVSQREKAAVDETTEILASCCTQHTRVQQTLAFFCEVTQLKNKKEDPYVPYHLRHQNKEAEEVAVHVSIEIAGPPTDELVLQLRMKELDRVRRQCTAIISASMALRETIENTIGKLESSMRALDGLLKRLRKPLLRRDTSTSPRASSLPPPPPLPLPPPPAPPEDAGSEDDEASGAVHPSLQRDHASTCKGCIETHSYVENCALHLGASVFRVQLGNQILKDLQELREAVVEKANDVDAHNEWDDW